MSNKSIENLKILLIEPRFDKIGTQCIPYGSGLLGSYLKKSLPEVDLQIHKLLTPILKYIKEKKPDVLGVANYVWNTNLCLKISKIAKEINPDILLVFGGPEINRQHVDKKRFAKLYSHIDLLVETEGEVAFTNIIKTYLDCDQNPGKLRERIGELGNCFFVKDDESIISGPLLPKIVDFNTIPSPYLTGLLDKFLANKHLVPMVETNRGCPFSCTYCQQGDPYYSKVKFKSLDHVKEELNYIAERVHPEAGLYIFDNNWGSYKQDIPIARHLKYLNETKNWPQFIDCDSGKSQYDRIKHIAQDILPGMMTISNSLQSSNPEVLKNIKRRQIKSGVELIKDFGGQVQSPDFILPLPGETKESFIAGLKALLDTGADVRPRVHPTALLSATELASQDTIDRYGFYTKYRQFSNFIGYCDGEFICEIENIILATKDMSLDGVFYCRVYTVILDAILRQAPLRELFAYLKSIGIQMSDLISKLCDDLPEAPVDIRDWLQEYRESYMEAMFDTEEEVLAYMKKHCKDYMLGNKGGDLLKYSMKLWIEHYSSMMNWLFNMIRDLAKGKDGSVFEELKNLELYTRHLYYDRSEDSSSSPVIEASFDYDIHKWFRTDKFSPLKDFKYPVNYTFTQTEYSGLSRQELWNSFGFYKSDSYQLPVGTDSRSRYYLSRLRRKVEGILENKIGVTSSERDGRDAHSTNLSI
ncbi:MAG: cobalamin-dependent protein [Candidatus Omnitrophica bacterium]|nr:cobalamin-dependent protein [Candidatus Omnitrophota bacterium]